MTECWPIEEIRHEIMAVLATLVGVACSAGDVDLGERGASRAPGGTSASRNGGAGGWVGSGGLANAAGHGGAAAVGSLPTGSGGAHPPMPSGGATAMTDGGADAADAADATDATDASPRITAGCGMVPLSLDTSIQVNGMTGNYILDLPTGYDNRRSYPVVIVFRGPNVTSAAFRTSLNLQSITGPDAIVVTPDCLNGASIWDVQRDTPLFDALLMHLESAYCVDPHRIFAVGHIAGGFFVNWLACLRAKDLRGIASLSGGPPMSACPGALAAWISLGNADVPPAIANGRADRDFWVQQNACDGNMSSPVDPAPCVEYAACNAGASVRYCEYNGDSALPSFAASGLWSFFKGL